jgi:signal transduction histidine kinase
MPIEPDPDTVRLRRALRDLVALSSVPAAWVGREPSAIAAGLADVLVGSLYLDFAFVRLCDPKRGVAVEATRGDAWKSFPEWLQRYLAVSQFSHRQVIPGIGGRGQPCRGVVIPIGVGAEGGLVAAASGRPNFPDEIDQLLLSVAANHGATACQSARLLHERRRAEEDLRQARNELEEALHQARADLAHVSRVTTMGELTASLAHEIKQPIAAAATNAQACLRWLARDRPDLKEAREAASRLVKDTTRASDIINRIRLLFKKGAPQRELVDANEIIREMTVLLRQEAARYAISIRAELASGLPQVLADRVLLQQVLMNLMLNGIEAMKDMNPAGELTIKSQQDEHHLLISVSDTGVGLPPEQADQIFKAFFPTKPQGTGIGLPISQSIIESHGGRLWPAANAGRGTTFHLTLPR